MKVQINKNILVNALEKMHTVSTRALIPNFSFTGKVTIEVKNSGRAVLTSSNGCLTVQEEVQTHDVSDKGICTTDSVKFRDAVKLIITESDDDPIELHIDGDMLVIRDAKAKRRKLVKLPQETSHHNTKVMKKPDGDSFFLNPERFRKGFRAVAPFVSKGSYPPQYQTIYMHWTGKETRMICGDGALFAIMSFPRHAGDSHKREFKRTILINQLAVVANILEGITEDIELIWQDKTTLWFQAGKTEILARGLPDIDYVNYESNAYRTQEAKAYADIKGDDLKEVTNLLVALQDKERAEQAKPYSCYITAPSTPGHIRFDIRKKQGKFQCEYEIPAEYYNLGNQPTFECCYAHLFFVSPCQTMLHPYLRLYLIDETGPGIVNARDAELGDKDRDGIPVIKEEEDECTFQFFFARLKDDEVDEADDGDEVEGGEDKETDEK